MCFGAYAADDNEKAIALFREALKLDAHYGLAQAYLAFAEVVANNYDAAPRALLVDCKARIDQALAIDPDDGRIHWLLAFIHSQLGEFDDENFNWSAPLRSTPMTLIPGQAMARRLPAFANTKRVYDISETLCG